MNTPPPIQGDQVSNGTGRAGRAPESDAWCVCFLFADYLELLELLALERQLNLTWPSSSALSSLLGDAPVSSVHRGGHHCLSGDMRKIGTIHNIQLACGTNLHNLAPSTSGNFQKCSSFIALLLRASSKTVQHLLWYTVRNDTAPLDQRSLAAKLLANTVHPSKLLLENVVHELNGKAMEPSSLANRSIHIDLTNTLSVLIAEQMDRPGFDRVAQKLDEMLNSFVWTQIDAILIDWQQHGGNTNGSSEHQLINMINILANLGNHSAIQLVHEQITHRHSQANHLAPDLLTVAIVHAYRKLINRFPVQVHLRELFTDKSQPTTCQIKQEIVQLILDKLDETSWKQSTNSDKAWPRYGFNELDQMFAEELR